MQLKEINGQLIAYRNSIALDIIDNDLDIFNDFLISLQVANHLRNTSDYLAENHWRLTIVKHIVNDKLVIDDSGKPMFKWEISVNSSIQQYKDIIEGFIKFNYALPILVFGFE
jgi:hypothetical protein